MAPAFLLLFVSPVWVAWSIPLVLQAAAARAAPADAQGGGCSESKCGNVSIWKPFWLVSEQATETKCGLLGFQVTCQNHTPYLGYRRANNHWSQFQIIDIFYGNGSLLVADVQKLQHFNNSGSSFCRFPEANSSSKLGLPFSISALNQNLIFYNCTKTPAERRDLGLVEMKCPNNAFARVGGRYNETDNYDGYYLEGCNAIVVPILGTSGKANASNYEQLISDGFLLTWSSEQPPSGVCSSSASLAPPTSASLRSESAPRTRSSSSFTTAPSHRADRFTRRSCSGSSTNTSVYLNSEYKPDDRWKKFPGINCDVSIGPVWQQMRRMVPSNFPSSIHQFFTLEAMKSKDQKIQKIGRVIGGLRADHEGWVPSREHGKGLHGVHGERRPVPH